MPGKILLTDKEIISRIQQNDRTILGELFVVNEKIIGSYIKKNGGNSNDAQDLLQEAIIALWQNINAGRFELSAKVSTYLFAIAKNKWMAESRRRKKFDHKVFNIEKEASDDNALSNIIDDEQKNRVGEALRQLDPPCRELLLLFYFEERKMAEIADLLHFANSDVAKAKKYQCKKALEKLLKDKIK